MEKKNCIKLCNALQDVSPKVRVQALNAMQRLQSPDDPNDAIVRLYQHHLSSDPSASVRMAVITSIGRNFHTLPSILERLWDCDERVRRHTYVQMCSYPVKSYKVAQRLIFLEQGLNDHSEVVRKVKKYKIFCNHILIVFFCYFRLLLQFLYHNG